MSSTPIYGIDLGTTYSCVAEIDEYGQATVLPNSDGQLTTPSVVFFENETSVVVGQQAKEEAIRHPDQVVSTVKRQMGRADWDFTAFGTTYDATEISSLIIKHLVQDVESQTGIRIEDVVITVPAYFGAEQREATSQAGVGAGLNVRKVISEPTAAALAFGFDREENQTVMVYDLGGGTFDVTVIDIKDGEIEVIATGGDHELGGKNWDELVARHFAEEFAAANDVSADDLADDLETWQLLMSLAEEAKTGLTRRDSIRKTVRHDGQEHHVEISRETFDSLTRSKLDETIVMTRDTIEDAEKKGIARIDLMLLVGGSTQMRQVKERLEQEFSYEIRMSDPHQSVAKGAALYGNMLRLRADLAERLERTGGTDAEEALVDLSKEEGLPMDKVRKLTETTLKNVSPKTFGIAVVDSDDPDVMKVQNLIMRNQSIPASETQTFYAAFEGQSEVLLECVEWLSDTAGGDAPEDYDPDTKLGDAMLDLGQPRPVGHPISVTLGLSDDGRVTLHGEDPSSGQTVRAEFQTDGLRSEEEMETLKRKIGGVRITI